MTGLLGVKLRRDLARAVAASTPGTARTSAITAAMSSALIGSSSRIVADAGSVPT